jgi:hypothetical protein
MLQLEKKQNIEAEQLKQTFCKVMVAIAQQIPESPTHLKQAIQYGQVNELSQHSMLQVILQELSA